MKRLWNWIVGFFRHYNTDLKLKQAVARVCLKPTDPLDPNGVFNE